MLKSRIARSRGNAGQSNECKSYQQLVKLYLSTANHTPRCDEGKVAKIFTMSIIGQTVFTYHVELDPCKMRTWPRTLPVCNVKYFILRQCSLVDT